MDKNAKTADQAPVRKRSVVQCTIGAVVGMRKRSERTMDREARTAALMSRASGVVRGESKCDDMPRTMTALTSLVGRD